MEVCQPLQNQQSHLRKPQLSKPQISLEKTLSWYLESWFHLGIDEGMSDLCHHLAMCADTCPVGCSSRLASPQYQFLLIRVAQGLLNNEAPSEDLKVASESNRKVQIKKERMVTTTRKALHTIIPSWIKCTDISRSSTEKTGLQIHWLYHARMYQAGKWKPGDARQRREICSEFLLVSTLRSGQVWWGHVQKWV